MTMDARGQTLLCSNRPDTGHERSDFFMMANKRINHRFTVIATSEPEFDEICMMVHADERIIFENKAAKPQANIVQIMPRRRR